MNVQHNIGVAEKIGKYSDAVLVPENSRWLFTAGTPGLSADGVLPDDFTSQATLAWENIIRLLHEADMDVHDIVKVTQILARPSDVEAYRPIRSHFLGDAKPASMLSFVNQLIWPTVLIELEIVAAKAASKSHSN